MSNGPLVPSKDALRALRSLAFSSSAALVGVTGSLCGVATIHYHECRRLRLAEHIIDRKRKLHSISNGKGAARLASMFEAAEKGEDFTLRRTGRSKVSDGRHYSAVAIQHDRETSASLDDILTESNDHFQRDAKFQPFDASPQQKAGSIGRSSRARYISPSRLMELPSRVARVFEESSVMRPFRSSKRDTVPQDLTDLNPLTKTSAMLADFNALFSEGSNIFSSMNPWDMDDENNLHEVDGRVRDKDEVSSVTTNLLNTYVALSQTSPEVQRHHGSSSRYDTNNNTIRRGIESMGTERYFYVFHTIMNTRQESGSRAGLDLLEHTMKLYTSTGKREDWMLVQALFLDCTQEFPFSMLRPIVWRLVEEFIRGDTPRLEVVSLLYPQCGAGRKSEKQHYYFPAHKYLEYRCGKCKNSDEQLIELRKILAGTQRCGVTLHEHLSMPILRSLCISGSMTQAEALIDEMRSVYKISISFYTLQELVRGHARLKNWSKIKAILDVCHRDSLTFLRAYGVSALLAHVITEYTKVGTPHEVHRFVLHCVREYGLQPISQITRQVVSLYLSHRQYDLVAAWIRTVTANYPHISTGTSTSAFAFEISCAWKNIDASCEDILMSCQAIATHSLRDPFSNAFRAVAAEATSRYLGKRFEQLQHETGIEMPRLTHGQIGEFETVLKQLDERGITRKHGRRVSLLLLDLEAQIASLHALNALFNGHLPTTGAITRWPYQYNKPTGARSVPERLPEASQLERELLNEYSEQARLGGVIRHENLRKIMSKLVGEGRHVDAFDLVRKIHESQWTQPPTGKEYDGDLFADWVQIAAILMSGSKLRYVLWAIVDASRELKVDSHILLLAKMALLKAHSSRFKHPRLQQMREAEYLKVRLARRRWATAERKEGLKFETWDGMSKGYH